MTKLKPRSPVWVSCSTLYARVLSLSRKLTVFDHDLPTNCCFKPLYFKMTSTLLFRFRESLSASITTEKGCNKSDVNKTHHELTMMTILYYVEQLSTIVN